MPTSMPSLSPETVFAAKRKVGELARANFYDFMRLTYREVTSNEPFIDALHLEAIAYQLERLKHGEIKRLIIAIPPRHFKSFAASAAFPAWILGHDPGKKIICASYGTELSQQFARQTRDIMRSPTYGRLFPKARLEVGAQAVDAFSTTAKGFRRATSVGGPVTGMGADYIIVDDPMKAGEAFSDVARNNVYEWCTGSLMSRFNNPAEGRMIVVMQRLHQEDLIGRLIADGGWNLLELRVEKRAETSGRSIREIYGSTLDANRFERPAPESAAWRLSVPLCSDGKAKTCATGGGWPSSSTC
jgi:hypothetical protein